MIHQHMQTSDFLMTRLICTFIMIIMIIIIIIRVLGETRMIIIEPRHEMSNNVVCATSKGSDQPVHTRSLIRAFARRLNIL